MTLTAIYLEIPGNPIALQRHRDSKPKWCMNPVTQKASFRSWKYNPQYKEMLKVKEIMKSQCPFSLLDEPLHVQYIFEMPIPTSWRKTVRKKAIKGELLHTKRPDTSNLIKFYEDCMNEVIFRDDSLILNTSAMKIYSAKPKTRIWIRTFTPKELLVYLEAMGHHG